MANISRRVFRMKAHGCIVFVNLFVIKLQQTAQDSSGKSVMLFIFSKVNLRERAKIELGWGTCMVQWWDSAILPPPFPPLPPSVPSFKIIYRTRENNESRIIKFGSVQLIIFLCVCVSQPGLDRLRVLQLKGKSTFYTWILSHHRMASFIRMVPPWR